MAARSAARLARHVARSLTATTAARFSHNAANTVAPAVLSQLARPTPAPLVAVPPALRRLSDVTVPTNNAEDDGMTELVRYFVNPADFYQALQNIGVDFFCGVPDSLLKDFCAYVTENTPPSKHIITANEGSAIALAAGIHLATKKYACVYLQNSGLGNAVNPLMSLAHPEVYSIPMLVLMGWRGEPGKKDEPQHNIQGEVTPAMLASMGIPFQILPDFIEGAEKTLQTARHYLDTVHGPYVLLVKRRTFATYKMKKTPATLPLNREGALQVLIDQFTDKDIVVGTTGMLSRELFEQRQMRGQTHEKDFLTVGSMGHASSIALGISLSKPRRHVICLDGDGAAIMHLGAMSTIGHTAGPNFKHIIFNNGAHDSVGGQPTDARHDSFDFEKISLGCGYRKYLQATTAEEISSAFRELSTAEGPALLEIFVNPGGHRKNLGRPTRSPIENKADFMRFLDRV